MREGTTGDPAGRPYGRPVDASRNDHENAPGPITASDGRRATRRGDATGRQDTRHERKRPFAPWRHCGSKRRMARAARHDERSLGACVVVVGIDPGAEDRVEKLRGLSRSLLGRRYLLHQRRAATQSRRAGVRSALTAALRGAIRSRATAGARRRRRLTVLTHERAGRRGGPGGGSAGERAGLG
jgi:hypothetical protein